MTNINHKRLEKQYLLLVSEIIHGELTNVNIYNPTVTSVELSKDSSHLTIFLTWDKGEAKGLEALENAKGLIRSLLARTINRRRTPEIHFKVDKSTEAGNRIDAILKEIKENK